MHRLLILVLLLSACGGIPVQMSSQSSKQTSKQEVAQDVAQEQQQQSAHQSESKQGTNSMPVIIICNTNNSANATCATPREGGALNDVVDSNLRRKAK